ncbi:MAG: hypothetical protein WBV46_14005 [Terriglobales bacterium]
MRSFCGSRNILWNPPNLGFTLHPMASSSDDSSGVPQRRQMRAEQSPQVSGSVTPVAQTGQ